MTNVNRSVELAVLPVILPAGYWRSEVSLSPMTDGLASSRCPVDNALLHRGVNKVFSKTLDEIRQGGILEQAFGDKGWINWQDFLKEKGVAVKTYVGSTERMNHGHFDTWGELQFCSIGAGGEEVVDENRPAVVIRFDSSGNILVPDEKGVPKKAIGREDGYEGWELLSWEDPEVRQALVEALKKLNKVAEGVKEG